MILLFTDFGAPDPYAGQLKAAILSHSPGAVVVDLLHTVPDYCIKSGAHLLAALATRFPIGCSCLAVVDPGVGSERNAVVMLADERWYVGPDNGLLSVLAARATRVEVWRIIWRPDALSDSFHGRDLFAPIAAWIDKGAFPHGKLADVPRLQVRLGAEDLAEIIYIDHYGNAMTGLRAASVPRGARLFASDNLLEYRRVFSEAPAGVAFWYENSVGLVEIALGRGHAARQLGLSVGDAVRVV